MWVSVGAINMKNRPRGAADPGDWHCNLRRSRRARNHRYLGLTERQFPRTLPGPREASEQRHAAVDAQIDASYKAAGVGCEEKRGAREFVGMPHPAQRNRRRNRTGKIAALFRQDAELVQDGRIGRPRTQNIDPNAARLELDRPVAGKGADRRLGTGIDVRALPKPRRRRPPIMAWAPRNTAPHFCGQGI